MSDASVAEALRSEVQRVVVEAPAGTGKTHQAASYARDATTGLGKGQRVLILAHTHSACNVFSSRTTDLAGRLRIGTIDSLVATISQIYHRALDLPADIHAWSIDRGQECYADLANRVRRLIVRSPGIADAVAERHPIIICDEHQDASSDQHAIVTLLAQAGAKVRFFGDPMQMIFSTGREREAHELQWRELVASANAFERLDTAHRWANGSPELGAWVLEQREHLRVGGSVDLRNSLPRGLRLLRADNRAPRFGGFQLSPAERRPLDIAVQNSPNLLVLTAHNQMAFGLNAFWGPAFRSGRAIRGTPWANSSRPAASGPAIPSLSAGQFVSSSKRSEKASRPQPSAIGLPRNWRPVARGPAAANLQRFSRSPG